MVDRPECSRCGNKMYELSACHYICSKCGGNLDCSDIGAAGK